MKIQMFTRDGGFVHEAIIPPFTPPPEILVWGSRYFVLAPQFDRDDSVGYVEGLAFWVLDGYTAMPVPK